MIDPNKSPLIERTAAFFAIAIVLNLFVAQALPYLGAWMHITLGESDRTMVQQVQTATINLAMLLAGYFWGTTSGRTKMEDTANKMATVAVAQQAEKTDPAQVADVVLEAGAKVEVAAAKPDKVKP